VNSSSFFGINYVSVRKLVKVHLKNSVGLLCFIDNLRFIDSAPGTRWYIVKIVNSKKNGRRPRPRQTVTSSNIKTFRLAVRYRIGLHYRVHLFTESSIEGSSSCSQLTKFDHPTDLFKATGNSFLNGFRSNLLTIYIIILGN